MSVDINALRGLLEKATPGPWEFGGWSGRCHKIHNGRPGGGHPGPPECVYDEEWHEPYCGKHEIASRSKAGAVVAGNYAYEEGGIINDADADLIIALRNNAGALLDEVDALKARLAAAEANIAALREKNKALNLRAQEAEGIIAKAGLVEGRPQGRHGRSLGRALANYYGAQQARRAEEAAAATAKVAAGLMRDRAEKAEAQVKVLTHKLQEATAAQFVPWEDGSRSPVTYVRALKQVERERDDASAEVARLKSQPAAPAMSPEEVGFVRALVDAEVASINEPVNGKMPVKVAAKAAIAARKGGAK